MNKAHLHQIFNNYIKRFDELNGPVHIEYYKWQIAKQFKPMMDEALAAPAGEFSGKLYEVKKLTQNVLDSYTQPFMGLVKFAEEEPETVRAMFKDLYAPGGEDMKEKQECVNDFLNRSHHLREKYYPDSYLYNDTVYSVTGYLLFYNPNQDYLYKPGHALAFADCIEFYDDWGRGDDVKLSVFYRMCDEVIQEIKNDEVLIATDATRFTGELGIDPETFHPDAEKHILLLDLIYCCTAYGLFDGITFHKTKASERHLMQERKDKAQALYEKLLEAQKRDAELGKAKAYLEEVATPGTKLTYKGDLKGIITNISDGTVDVKFEDGDKKCLGLYIAAANGLIALDVPAYEEKIAQYKTNLKEADKIKAALSYAEREFSEYADYLG